MTKKWQQWILGESSKIVDVLTVLEQSGSGVCFIVDGNNKLLGTVSDGDIRRALLDHASLETEVTKVMNHAPRVCHLSDSPEQRRQILEKNRLLHLPVLENGILVDVSSLYELVDNRKYPNAVFLMAGGFGTRLRPLTENCPKPLLKIGDKPILETTLRRFIESGFYNFYISTHYLPDMIREHFGDGSKWGVSIEYVHEDDPLGTAGALGLLPPEAAEHPVLMINGDILTKVNFASLLEFHQQSKAHVTMCVRKYDFQVPYGVVEAKDGFISQIVEKPVHEFFVNAGIYVLNGDIVSSVTCGDKIDMPTLVEGLIEEPAGVSMYPVHEYWLDIGRMADFERAQKEYWEFFV